MTGYNTIREYTLGTLEHINTVGENIATVIGELEIRAEQHDQSKLSNPEVSNYIKYKSVMEESIPGTPQYEEAVTGLGKTIEYHHSKNSHHPEFYTDGISGMNLIDIMEMFCDWQAETDDELTINMLDFIELKQVQFGFSDELKYIFINTVKYLDGKNPPLTENERKLKEIDDMLTEILED